MEPDSPLNVRFLCTHNSARSIMAECVINRLGYGKYRGYSAGSQPSGKVHPYAMGLLRQLNYDRRRCAQSRGKSSPRRKLRSSISCPRSATTQPMKRAPYGRASR
jgi:hypothetical protein